MFTMTIVCLVGIACGGFQPIRSPTLYGTEKQCTEAGELFIDASPLPPGMYVVVCRPVPVIPQEHADEVG